MEERDGTERVGGTDGPKRRGPLLTATRRFPRRALRALLFLGYGVAVVLVAIYFIFFRPFVAQLRADHPPPTGEIRAIGPADAETIRQVGSIVTGRVSSFVRFPPKVAPGRRRICAFGDSYTYGDEVKADQDFPSQLRSLLARDGFDDVEVLNFGSPWHGFHQAHILWDRVGRKMGCETLLLGPGSFWSKRDAEFNHTNLIAPYYLHARYVLDGDESVRLARVLGKTHEERFAQYFRFVPRWRYLRYDRNAPTALLSLMPRDRTLRNPFYYRLGPLDEEMMRIYRILLQGMAQDAERVVLNLASFVVDGGISDAQIEELARELDLPNVAFGHAFRGVDFPYRAPKGHNSAWGNRIVAEQFLALLTGSRQAGAIVLRSSEPVAPRESSILPEALPLSTYHTITLQLDEMAAGSIVTASPDASRTGLGSPRGLFGSEVASLLAIVAPDTSVVDAALVPLDFVLRGGETLRWAEGSEDEERRVAGVVHLIDPNLPLGVVVVDALRFRDRQYLAATTEAIAAGLTTDSALTVAGRPALDAWSGGDELTFAPPPGRSLYRFAALEGQLPDLDQLPGGGTWDLVLERIGDGARRIPIARWEKARLPFVEPLSRLDRPMSRREPSKRE